MSTTLYLRSPSGTLLAIISDFVKLEYARAENKVGYLYLDLDPSTIDASKFYLNCRLEVWRRVGENPAYLDGETIFFIRKWSWHEDDNGRELFSVEAKDPIYLLSGRVAPFPPNHTYDEISDLAADDALATIVEENLGATARDPAGAIDPLRNLSTYLNIKDAPAIAPHIYKNYSYRNILDTMQEIVATSLGEGWYLSFDIVYASPSMLEFRTYSRYRGVNHGSTSGQPVIISPEARNLIKPEYTEDHIDEITYLYATGLDESGTPIDEVISHPNPDATPDLNRREGFMDEPTASSSDFVHSGSTGELWTHSYKRFIAGTLQDTDGCRYGLHYRFGDLVYVKYKGVGYNAHVNAIHVTVEEGRETIDNRIEADV